MAKKIKFKNVYGYTRGAKARTIAMKQRRKAKYDFVWQTLLESANQPTKSTANQ